MACDSPTDGIAWKRVSMGKIVMLREDPADTTRRLDDGMAIDHSG
jgi:hypothetical protein